MTEPQPTPALAVGNEQQLRRRSPPPSPFALLPPPLKHKHANATAACLPTDCVRQIHQSPHPSTASVRRTHTHTHAHTPPVRHTVVHSPACLTRMMRCGSTRRSGGMAPLVGCRWRAGWFVLVWFRWLGD